MDTNVDCGTISLLSLYPLNVNNKLLSITLYNLAHLLSLVVSTDHLNNNSHWWHNTVTANNHNKSTMSALVTKVFEQQHELVTIRLIFSLQHLHCHFTATSPNNIFEVLETFVADCVFT